MILENIRRLCEQQGISISKLEKQLGFGNATIRGWGRASPTADKLKKVADYFGVSMESLMVDTRKEATT